MAIEFNDGNHNERTTLFAEVLLPLPLPRTFTYRVPHQYNQQIEVGARVIVQFGKRRIITGVTKEIHENPPKSYEAKYILELLDDIPTVTGLQFQLFDWMADYYMCQPGDVLNASLPSGLKLHSESRIQKNPDFEYEIELTDTEQLLMNALEHADSLKYEEASKVTGISNIYQLIKSLIKKGSILVFEEVKEKYKPKTVSKVRINPDHLSEKALQDQFKQLESKPKQLDVLMKYLQRVPILDNQESNEEGLEKGKLIDEGCSLSSLKTLIKNNLFQDFHQVVSRFPKFKEEDLELPELSDAQTKARDEVITGFEKNDIALLHGITGSGKTEIYIDLINEVLKSGSQVLYLLPEIALTTQIVTRLRKAFGNSMAVYHSKFSDNERVEVWQGLQDGKFNIVVGVRSSIFLPFDSLGLIIVDEEHETSYKQYDPSPRYNARDVALVLSKIHNAKTLLGSATPSFESYFNALEGNWSYILLTERFGSATLPTTELAENKIPTHLNKTGFSPKLVQEIKTTMDKNEQVMIFQNRRGYAPVMICEECAHTQQCQHCNVSLTFHQYTNELRCHYCGYLERHIHICQDCGSSKIKIIGHGTEKIEEDLKLMIPEAGIQRMDFDTTRKKNSYEQIINDFSAHKTDVLVGTQMISKGLDFDNVTLVGIFDADSMIHFPDFRAQEHAFQMMMQVSGRAGRKSKKGKVIIQTRDAGHPIFNRLISQDYHGFYESELNERLQYFYPPYSRLIKIIVKHVDRSTCHAAALKTVKLLRTKLGAKRVLGPEPPVIDRIRNQFINHIIIKLERKKINLPQAKGFIKQGIDSVKIMKDFKSTTFVIDVDPL